MNYSESDKRNYYILSCRYYNGEEQDPYENQLQAYAADKSHLSPAGSQKFETGLSQEQQEKLQTSSAFWFYEKHWVEEHLHGHSDLGRTQEYIAYGNEGFESEDGTPIDLKALLWNRYYHWGGFLSSQETFRNWYKIYYQSEPTHRQKRAEERKIQLIKKCHYYHAEQSNPWDYPCCSGVNSWRKTFWNLEKKWVEELSMSYRSPYANHDLLKHLGLEDYFEFKSEAKSLISYILGYFEKVLNNSNQSLDKESAIQGYEGVYLKYIPLGNSLEKYFGFYLGEEVNPHTYTREDKKFHFWQWEKTCFDQCKGNGYRSILESAKSIPSDSQSHWLLSTDVPIEIKALSLYIYNKEGIPLQSENIQQLESEYLNGLP